MSQFLPSISNRISFPDYPGTMGQKAAKSGHFEGYFGWIYHQLLTIGNFQYIDLKLLRIMFSTQIFL